MSFIGRRSYIYTGCTDRPYREGRYSFCSAHTTTTTNPDEIHHHHHYHHCPQLVHTPLRTSNRPIAPKYNTGGYSVPLVYSPLLNSKHTIIGQLRSALGLATARHASIGTPSIRICFGRVSKATVDSGSVIVLIGSSALEHCPARLCIRYSTIKTRCPRSWHHSRRVR